MVIICTGSILNTLYTRRISLALAWVGTFALQAIVSSLILWCSTGFCPMEARLSAMTGVTFILFTFYMVTDPATTPFEARGQIAFGLAVAALYGLLVTLHIVFGFFFALTLVSAARGLALYARGLSPSAHPTSVAAIPPPAVIQKPAST
jgi:Na+-translocating ferredoxin:NAD+ oxidoreductase RnfD subunit